jgi:hypothetical protein
LPSRRFQAAATASRHVVIAAADIERLSVSRQRLGIRSIGEPMQGTQGFST